MLVNEDFTFLDLIVAIYLAIRANAGSSSALWKMAIMLECLPLAHLAVLANDIDLDAANVLIENRLLLSLFSFLLFFGRSTVRRSLALLFLIILRGHDMVCALAATLGIRHSTHLMLVFIR